MRHGSHFEIVWIFVLFFYSLCYITLLPHLDSFKNENKANKQPCRFFLYSEPISAVTVNSAGKQPIQNESFTLSCNVSGPADYIHWMKNNQMISADSFFSVVNKTLTINSVQHSDNGNYSCEAFNAVSNKTSNPYSLLVNCK